jgi:hypothetical protein
MKAYNQAIMLLCLASALYSFEASKDTVYDLSMVYGDINKDLYLINSSIDTAVIDSIKYGIDTSQYQSLALQFERWYQSMLGYIYASV